MIYKQSIRETFQFNPLKHHFNYIREFIKTQINSEKSLDVKAVVKEVKHIGSSVMDVYTGSLSVEEICSEIHSFLEKKKLNDRKRFSAWTGTTYSDYRTVTLPDSSVWTIKYHNDETRFIHIFPARLSPHSFRVKANTLKSALLYYILIGKDFITREDLNIARKLLGLSPVRTTSDAEAITELIEVLREERGERRDER